MTKRVVLVGLRPDFVEQFRRELGDRAIDVEVGATVDDLRALLTAGDADHVFLGGGLEIATRVAAVQLIFELSDRATVHMKDARSGPESMVSFVTAVLRGLADYAPPPSPNAILRAKPRA